MITGLLVTVTGRQLNGTKSTTACVANKEKKMYLCSYICRAAELVDVVFEVSFSSKSAYLEMLMCEMSIIIE